VVGTVSESIWCCCVTCVFALSCRWPRRYSFIDAEHASDSDVAVARCADNLQRVLEPVRGLPWCLGLGWHGDRIDSRVQRAVCSCAALCNALWGHPCLLAHFVRCGGSLWNKKLICRFADGSFVDIVPYF
jgi:hypothetical protein